MQRSILLGKAAVFVSKIQGGLCRVLLSPGSYKHTVPDLPYDYKALEPVMSAEILRVHHDKHHTTYVNNLNIAEEQMAEAIAAKDVVKAISLQSSLRFNAGGHLNHSMFWQNLSPNGGGKPSGRLANAINADFGSFEEFKTRLTARTIAVQGSGWGYLAYNPVTHRLEVTTTSNQDLLEATTGLKPLLIIDVWEHAYYLQYKNMRADFVKAIWDIINWNDVTERYNKCAA
ncbi:unnamed protein product [Calicophoron daubneyi]|uniref:Superoxide dismutase n=1 Tax=Calicophoron daubneyi TaxID=300641 RepID=A0AAV2T7I1_CALDB